MKATTLQHQTVRTDINIFIALLMTLFTFSKALSQTTTPSTTIQNITDMKTINSKTIILIHGAFVTKDSWGGWKEYFESKGYTVIVPAWPFKEDSAAALRAKQPNSDIASLRLNQVLDHYANIIKKLPEKPIAIGHSYGGLITQLLVQRDLVAAGVAIHSVPPQGVFTFKWSFYKAATPALGIFTSSKKAYMMTQKQWNYAFTNGMSPEIQTSSYEAYTAPESKLLSRDALTKASHVNFKQPHAPLLFIAGSADHIIPASLNYSNFKRYAQNNGSVTDFKEFEGNNHYVVGMPNWKTTAGYALDWINAHAVKTEVAQNK